MGLHAAGGAHALRQVANEDTDDEGQRRSSGTFRATLGIASCGLVYQDTDHQGLRHSVYEDAQPNHDRPIFSVVGLDLAVEHSRLPAHARLQVKLSDVNVLARKSRRLGTGAVVIPCHEVFLVFLKLLVCDLDHRHCWLALKPDAMVRMYLCLECGVLVPTEALPENLELLPVLQLRLLEVEERPIGHRVGNSQALLLEAILIKVKHHGGVGYLAREDLLVGNLGHRHRRHRVAGVHSRLGHRHRRHRVAGVVEAEVSPDVRIIIE
mmetsp:Transcript_124425/g.277520  ORF Transcript_124425/g.277520 Transcript_124425/m.277520 type:complete len:266 (+) Transcript_124425:395-1192(+)